MYSFTSRVRFSECDEQGCLSVPAIINYLQDCSTFHSESIGMGPAHAKETGLAWLLAAWEVEIAYRPRFGEEIAIYTWATSFKGLFARRNFMICAADDTECTHPFVQADSSWFMFDAAAQRPVRIPESESAGYAEDTPALKLPPLSRVLKVEGEGTPASPIAVTGAHLDTNHHVNNAQYVSLALGALEELDAKLALQATSADKPYILDVYYATAAKLGDTMHPHIHEAEDGTYITLDNEESKPFAIVRLRKR